MKHLAIATLFAASTLYTTASFADDAEVRPLNEQAQTNNGELPLREKAFVDAVGKLNKKAIVEQLGEPAKADDVRIKGTDKVVASIWHYHSINTAEDGSYYATTELDFVEDNVVQVVFLNNDGSEVAPTQKYEIKNHTPQSNPEHTLGDGVPLLDLGK